jgi:2-oxoglutarate ferredoxin oxidoreductase subunit delta
MARIEIDINRCKGCGLCTIACPRSLIVLSDTLNAHGFTPAVITCQEECTGCTLCAEICPDVAITVYR